MRRVYAKHEPYTDGHLAQVVADMRLAGPPTIRAVELWGELFALEGSHRLASANYLGLEPKLVVLVHDGSDLPMHWEKVKKTLPIYEFERVHVLDLNTAFQKREIDELFSL